MNGPKHSEQSFVLPPSVGNLLTVSTDRGLWLWLMELYEDNYLLLTTLCGSLKDLPERWLSRREEQISIVLDAHRLGPFTTVIRYRFSLPDMTMTVLARLYHDARLCEAMHFAHEHPTHDGCDDEDFLIDQKRFQHQSVQAKWTVNHLFRRWLEYGLAKHYFLSGRLAPTSQLRGKSHHGLIPKQS